PLSEIISMHLSELFLPEDRNRCENIFIEEMKSDKGFTLKDFYVHRSNGKGVPVDISASVTTFKDKRVIHCILHDITEQKNMEDDLRESEQKHRQLIENLSEDYFCYIHDTNGTFQYVSPSVTKILGYSQNDFLNYFTQFYSDHPANNFARKSNELCRQGYQQPSYELEVFSKDGRFHWLEISEVPIFDDDHNPLAVEGIAHDISERKEAESALKKGEENLARAQRIAKLGSWSWDVIYNILEWSEEIYRIFEVDQNEFKVSYESFLDFVHPDDREMVKKAFSKALEEKSPYSIDHRITLLNGGEKIVHEQGEVIFSGDGNDLKMIGTIQDITEQKTNENELLLFRNMINQSNDSIYVADAETGRYIYVNDASCITLGFSREELLTMKVCNIVVSIPDDNAWKKHVRDIKKKGFFVRSGENRRKNGSIFPIEANVKSIDYGKKCFIIAIVRDITNRKKAESALRESKERYRTLFEESRAAICITRSDGKFIDVNHTLLEMLGFTKKELMKIRVMDIYMDAKERRKFQKEIEMRGFLRDYSLELKTKNGSAKECLITSALRRKPGNNKYEYQSIIRDVTEEKKLQARIQEQERIAAVGQLSAGIAHDFNNMLMGIMGYAQLILRNKELPVKVKDQIEVILQQGNRASDLIRQILDFSKKTVLRKRALDFALLLDETVKVFKHTIREDITVELEIANGKYVVNSDPTQLQQVITNLFVNAQDAMPKGGKLKIKLLHYTHPHEKEPLSNMKSGDWLKLSVSDTGIGIKTDDLSHIYEPFFTTKSTNNTGLGLSQVYGIIGQHDGHIQVSSEVGEGTTFDIFIPITKEVAEERKQPKPYKLHEGKGETILIVEDEVTVLDIINNLLDSLGYSVLTASNGKEALKTFHGYRDTIDLVLTDVVMPEMGGVELFRELRMKSPDIKVVMMSGYPLDDDGKKLFSEGIHGWLHKPMTLEKLARQLRKALD
ncbi:MAG: PAS domain S-box protein, partial [Nitrospinae bacterium]|nr:PAS domain S-box protein [Nitrospinota bacterium]